MKVVNKMTRCPSIANDGILDGLDYLRQICPMLIIDETKDHFVVHFCSGAGVVQQSYKRKLCEEMMGHHKKHVSWLQR